MNGGYKAGLNLNVIPREITVLEFNLQLVAARTGPETAFAGYSVAFYQSRNIR